MLRSSRKWSFPTPFEFAIALTALVFLLVLSLTEATAAQALQFWGQGLWGLLKFMTQMCLILLGGFVLAISSPVQLGLQKIVRIPQSTHQSLVLTFFVASLSCWVNWGLGLVVGAFFSLEMARFHKNLSFPFLVSISYTGFLFWHGGLSGSIPLVLNTPGSFSEKWVGGTIELSQTIFSVFNIALILLLFFIMILFILFSAKKNSFSKESMTLENFTYEEAEDSQNSPVSLSSRIFYWIFLSMGFAFLISQILRSQFRLGLNEINLILILLGLICHKTAKSYLQAVESGCKKLSPILIQYPLYAGIMGLIVDSGLASLISQGFVEISHTSTYPFYMFLSAGVVNFFVPSGGGQWAVQAPIVIEGAKQLGVPLWKASLAVAWGDAWTNLAQPFWALPLLSIVGLGLRDIMDFCLKALFVSGVTIGGFFLFF